MKKFFISVLAVLLIFEEWLWDVLTILGHRLIEWLHISRVELWLLQTSPSVALIAIGVPIAIVTPINIAALGLLADGLIWKGLLLQIVAKLTGTVLIARVFALTKPQLMTFSIVRFVYSTIMSWLQWAHRKVIETAAYRWAKLLRAQIELRMSDWLGRLKQLANFRQWLTKRDSKRGSAIEKKPPH